MTSCGPDRSDAAIAAVVWLVSAVLVQDPVARAVAAGLAGPVAVRHTRPALALAMGTVVAVAHLVLLVEPLPAIVAVPLLVHAFARWSGPGALARTGLGIALAGAVAGPRRWLAADPGPLRTETLVVPVTAHIAVVWAAYAWGTTARHAAERAEERRPYVRPTRTHGSTPCSRSTVFPVTYPERASTARSPRSSQGGAPATRPTTASPPTGWTICSAAIARLSLELADRDPRSRHLERSEIDLARRLRTGIPHREYTARRRKHLGRGGHHERTLASRLETSGRRAHAPQVRRHLSVGQTRLVGAAP